MFRVAGILLVKPSNNKPSTSASAITTSTSFTGVVGLIGARRVWTRGADCVQRQALLHCLSPCPDRPAKWDHTGWMSGPGTRDWRVDDLKAPTNGPPVPRRSGKSSSRRGGRNIVRNMIKPGKRSPGCGQSTALLLPPNSTTIKTVSTCEEAVPSLEGVSKCVIYEGPAFRTGGEDWCRRRRRLTG
jgi:hypothetical protein